MGRWRRRGDILEQVVEEFLVHRGYFVRHNVTFLPRRDHPDFVLHRDSNHSDIDVIGVHPRLAGPDRVIAVRCKSWQQGFRPASGIAAIEWGKTIRGYRAWQGFRELTRPKWSEAFVAAVAAATGYVTAVSRVIGERAAWEEHPPFRAALGGNRIRLRTFREMALEIQGTLTRTLAATEVGRMPQMFRAAGIHVEPDVPT